MTEPTRLPTSKPAANPTPAASPQPAATPPAPPAPPPVSPAAGRKVLERMLDRLFAALVNGPSINCRPHRSRQRLDWYGLSALNDVAPIEALRELLGEDRKTVLRARTPKTKGDQVEAAIELEESDALVDQPIEAGVDREPSSGSNEAVEEAGAESSEMVEPAVAPVSPSPRSRKGPLDPQEEQKALLQKLHIIAEDARTYEQDTGVHVLNVGFPLLSLPPAFAANATGRQSSRRILAPIAFIPVSLVLRRGATRSVEIACRADGVDLVQPNVALLAWLQRQTGKAQVNGADLFADEKGENPWREVTELVRRVCDMVDLAVPEAFAMPAEPAPKPAAETPNAAATVDAASTDPTDEESSESEEAAIPSAEATPSRPSPVAQPATTDASSLSMPVLELQVAPRTDDLEEGPQIITAGVLGLFPVANQGLLRDMQAMIEDPSALKGPISSFIRVGDMLDSIEAAERAQNAAVRPPELAPVAAAPIRRDFSDERLVASADPCQARAVRLARQSTALVIHGPPGTGKSQTIANIIGDHLSRGQRVLFVCEKRTALDVVADRLEHMGLGNLTGVVHDPQRDQRELYKKIRDQLDNLHEAKDQPRAHKKLAEVDAELRELHTELTDYRQALVKTDADTGYSLHELMGQWLAASPGALLGGQGEHLQWRVTVDSAAATQLAKTRLKDLSPLQHALRETFLRAAKVAYAKNPWTAASGIALAPFLARPVEQNRSALAAIVAAAATADETSRDSEPLLPPFTIGLDLNDQAAARVQVVENVMVMLDHTPPEVLDRWSLRDFNAIQTARQKITEAQPYLVAFKQQVPEPELKARWLQNAGKDLPAVKDLTQQRSAVQRYAEAFGISMQWVDQIRQKAPQAKWGTISRWLSFDAQLAGVVLKKLEAATPLAAKAGLAPLDPELLAQYRRQPFDIAQVLRWQSAIETYLPIAQSFLGFLHGAKKKAAAPVVEFFGLGLSFESATRVRDFLTGLRARLETLEATNAALGATTFPASAGLPEDAELLGTFNEHRSVLKAAADLHRPALPGGESAADATALVNQMVAAEYSAAEPTFHVLDLPPTPQNAARIMTFINALVIRVVLQTLNENALDAPTPDDLMEDQDLEISLRGHAALFDVALAAMSDPLTKDVWPAVAGALVHRDQLHATLDAIRLSPQRAKAVTALEKSITGSSLFLDDWQAQTDKSLRSGEAFLPAATALQDHLDSLEDVIRVKESLAKVPPSVRPAVQSLLMQSAAPEEAWDVLRRDIVAGEIRRQLAADPQLQSVDGHRLSSAFERYRELEGKKRELVCTVIVDRWVHDQRDKMLSESGSRLNSAGAELKRRLLLRGERAMRLRQVVSRGRQIPGGDPLFDVCPVWMVSPETAAQVFPLEAIFDVVVFDEASQCRLEEALPVLMRGRRVVIAGDPKQLPPTRFFETAFAASDDDEEPSSDQAWFELQQGEVEDLLTAALGLEAQQSYLDVHYRSRNAALIEFSNEHFYNSRLQPIPGHPSRRPDLPPIRLLRVGGVYEKRQNEIEAAAVVSLVAELLAEKKPPSIGIACFNMMQRDLIVELLDDKAAEDPKFAKKLGEARDRVGEGTFEGLFIKNLENVQGDERDHMIISTTYGPDSAGRFYRRFGPLAMPGGGRRLNVLVTRARQQVHLVTSIPESAYRSLPEPGEGQTPGGGWLLFAYLKYADELTREYDGVHNAAADGAQPSVPETQPVEATAPTSPVRIRPTRTPSQFAEALAQKLSNAHGASADVYWGNDGFCVDLALRHEGDDGVPLGVLCDAARFAPAEDLMEWDVFRAGILEAQGWKLHRVWTPHFFRDPVGRTQAILRDAGRVV